jgi:heptose-I-phosphate ethanolaminephosphotransferase
VVLVITDSINRDNMGLYGYGRPTTPRLQAHKARAGEQMAVLKNAWSVDASTLPALRNMFHFGLPESDNPPHVLALARAAGYKVWWISNHDDLAIEQQHARFADVVDMVNRTPGRASASLDGEILDCVQEAFADTSTDRKLIVVHLMGAHPHYSLRFPANANPFDDDVDAVETGLVKEGRSAWVRRFRQEYDAALLYHDFVVSELLQQTRSAGKTRRVPRVAVPVGPRAGGGPRQRPRGPQPVDRLGLPHTGGGLAQPAALAATSRAAAVSRGLDGVDADGHAAHQVGWAEA